jgi:hypothetical protein
MAAATRAGSAVPVTRIVLVRRSAASVRTPSTSLTRALIARTLARELIAGTRNDMTIMVQLLVAIRRLGRGAVMATIGARPVRTLTTRCQSTLTRADSVWSATGQRQGRR